MSGDVTATDGGNTTSTGWGYGSLDDESHDYDADGHLEILDFADTPSKVEYLRTCDTC